jgi:hypothetical protein
MNQEAFVVLGSNLIYKNEIVVRIMMEVEWCLSGRYDLEFDDKKLYIIDYQHFNW